MNKAERAEAMLKFINEAIASGRTVYLSTALRAYKISRKHLSMVRVHNGSLEVQHGKNWLDATYTNLSAA